MTFQACFPTAALGMSAPLVRAVGSAVGTIAVFGVGVLVTTSILTNTVKAVVTVRQVMA